MGLWHYAKNSFPPVQLRVLTDLTGSLAVFVLKNRGFRSYSGMQITLKILVNGDI